MTWEKYLSAISNPGKPPKKKGYTNDYPIVAEAKGHEVLAFERFGSYQGEWLMVSRDKENYYIWKGYYGSCSGCDAFEGEFGYGDIMDEERVQRFARDYEPYLEVPRDQFVEMKVKGTLIHLFPANIVDGYTVTKEDLEKFINELKIYE